MESSRTQATLGKWLLKIFVTDVHGNRLSFSMAAIRCWPMYLPQLAHGANFAANFYLNAWIYGTVIVPGILLPIISCLLIIYLPRNQGAHDWLAGTLVVKGKPGTGIRS